MHTSTSSRTRRVVVATALVVVGAVVGSVTATAVVIPTFSDVPGTHPFFDEIEWMASTGISNGYPDGTYRPNDPVTRQAMSAFMQRLYDLQDDMSWASSSSSDSTSSGTFGPLTGGSVGVIVPDGAFANIRATFNAESYCSGDVSAWCSVRLMISEDGGPYTEMQPAAGLDYGFDSPGNADGGADRWEAHTVTRMFDGSPGHVYNVRVDLAVVGTASLFVDDWTLVAETDLQPSSFSPS